MLVKVRVRARGTHYVNECPHGDSGTTLCVVVCLSAILSLADKGSDILISLLKIYKVKKTV